nr:YaaA family protein [Veillonella denticariosi]
MNWLGLSDRAKRFGERHLVILSALYGIVEPHMGGFAIIASTWWIKSVSTFTIHGVMR